MAPASLMTAPTWERWTVCLLVIYLTGWAALAGGPLPVSGGSRKMTAISQSGQFSVVGDPIDLGAKGAVIAPAGNQPEIHLRPDLLAVTSERIRRAVNDRLGLPDRAGIPVHFALRPAHFEEGAVTIVPRLFRDGWQLFAELPDTMEWERLIRLLVEANVLDHVNRNNPGEPFARPPLWLSEGLTGLLLGDRGRDLIAESQTVLNRTARRADSLAVSRQVLADGNPLSFSDLSQPTDQQLNDAEAYRRYRASATLMVFEMLRDEKGRRTVQEFIRQTHRYLNWQMALLSASGGHFRSLLEVEKWWAVASIEALGHDPAQFWGRDRVLAELAVILTETADIRQTNAPAGGTVRRTLPLREIVAQWDFPTQRPVLHRKLGQLRLLSIHAPPDIAPLVLESVQIIDEYLTVRERGGADPEARMELETRTSLLVRTTIRRLAALDNKLISERRSL